MPTYSYDHIHLRSPDPMATAQYYHTMFDAKIIESVRPDGTPRIDLDLNGLTIFIAPIQPDAAIPSAPAEPYRGLDHFGLRVDNMDAAAAALKQRGATFTLEPRTIRPGTKIAFVQAPDNVRIELVERS
jgi:lactoylglutathione lyase